MEDKVNTAAIVCGIVFPVLILTLIVVIVLCYRRWKKHQGDIGMLVNILAGKDTVCI